MIISKTQIMTTLILSGGCIVLLAVPNWVSYVLIISVSLVLGLQSALNHPQLLKTVKNFALEFLGFSLLVGCFVGTMIAMYGLLLA